MNKKIINTSILLLSLSNIGAYAVTEKEIVLQENPVDQIVQDEALYQELKSQYKEAKKKRAKKRKKLGIKKKKKNKGDGFFSRVGKGIAFGIGAVLGVGILGGITQAITTLL